MKNKILIFLLALVVLNACQPKKNHENANIYSSEFIWKGDSLGSSYFDNSAIIIPIESEKIGAKNTYLQLQASVRQQFVYQDFVDNLAVHDFAMKSKEFLLKGKIGSYDFDSVHMPLVFRKYSAADSIIGCIGFDFFETKQILLDFKHQNIQFADEFKTENAQAISYEIYLDSKILVPVKLNGKEVFFLLNPLSPLYVMFNKVNIGSVEIGGKPYVMPNTQMIEDANPAFCGILGYAFFKERRLIIDTESEVIYILN